MSNLFGQDYISQHLGSDVKYRDRLYGLQEVEAYFQSLCEKNGIEHSIDCTANETSYYKTLNCTTYAGLFIAHPLCFSETMFQMFDAKADNMAPQRHLGYIKSNLAKGEGSKYLNKDGEEFAKDGTRDFKGIVGLPGSNKVYEHVESKRFKSLIEGLGSDLVIKPHPLTTDEIIADINNIKGDAHLASRQCDLYDLIERAEVVYTTHISETALTGLLMGKKVEPLDPFDTRLTGAFAHINYFCFAEADPVSVLGSIMASPKSGVIHPDVDANWKPKLDLYFEYTLSKRERQRNHYGG